MTPFIFKNAGAFYRSMSKYGINTPLRIAHFFGQLAHESGNFTKSVEIWNVKKPTKAQAGYQTNKNLGNRLPGDGYKFRGRGLIQLTGRYNYEQYRDYSGVDVINNPDLASRLDISIDIACWYWAVYKKMNVFADKDSVLAVSKKINGYNKATGLPNGLVDRKVKTAFFKQQKITIDVLKKNQSPNPQQAIS